jgi:hypothetical protein
MTNPMLRRQTAGGTYQSSVIRWKMAEDAIENGMSVTVFVNFSETVRHYQRLDTNCVVGEKTRAKKEIIISQHFKRTRRGLL